jgi:TatA/E family protein of Tat protein translocase
MFGLGAFEIAIIAFLALIFIGPSKLPELAKGMGKFLREFQDAVHGMKDMANVDLQEEAKKEVTADQDVTEELAPEVEAVAPNTEVQEEIVKQTQAESKKPKQTKKKASKKKSK